MTTLHLDALLNPTCIAVVGASARDGSKGFTLMQNLTTGGFKAKETLKLWFTPTT